MRRGATFCVTGAVLRRVCHASQPPFEQVQSEPGEVEATRDFDAVEEVGVAVQQCARAEDGREDEQAVAEEDAGDGAVGGATAVLSGNAQTVEGVGTGDEDDGDNADEVLGQVADAVHGCVPSLWQWCRLAFTRA